MTKLSVATRRSLWRYVFPLIAGGLALVLYSSTAAPWLTWANDGADGGDLVTAAMTWGVPHPTGYPTYCWVARLYAFLPLGSVARRFNLLSATMAAASVALVYLCALRVVHEASKDESWLLAIVALIVALAWAASHTLWSQATIAEVYTLQAFFSSLCLYLALRDDLMGRPRHWAILGLALGLGLGAHLTITLMVPGLAVLLWPHVKRERLLALCLGALLGLGTFLYLPLAASADPPINWGNPRTWEGFWWVTSGKPYHGYAFSLPLAQLPSRLGAWVQLWSRQYTWLGLGLALVGLWSWLEAGQARWALATGLIFSTFSVYAICYDTTDSYVYLISAYLAAALWMAEGARVTLTGYATRGSKSRYAGLALVLIVLTALPVWSVLRQYEDLDLSNDHTVAQWVNEVLAELPRGGLLITGEDRHTFALDYAIWVERRRQDLLVVDGELLQYPWYMDQVARLCPAATSREQVNSPRELIAANLGSRAIYLASPRRDLEQAYETRPRGVLWEITGRK